VDKKENTETAQIREGRPGWDRKGWHVVFLIAPVACLLLLPSEGLFFYLHGRLGRHITFPTCMLYPATGGFLLFCVGASLMRLLVGWGKCTSKTRLLIAAEIGIPIVVAALCIALIFSPVESRLSPPGVAFLYGFRDRVRSRADISAIRSWLKTLDKGDYVPRRDYYSPDTLPEPLKGLGLGMVSLSEDKSGNPEVNISAGGGFHHWGATIGLEDMVIPESDLRFHYDAWLLVEPGVYVYAW